MDDFFIDYSPHTLYNKNNLHRGSVMKKKAIILSSLILTTGIITSTLAFSKNDNLFVKAEFEDEVSHQIIFDAEDTSVEKESTYTKYFALHKDNATRSGYSIDSTPEECLIMADGDRDAGGDSICFGEANPLSGTYASLIVTIPLTNIESFTSAVFRGRFYSEYDYSSDPVTEIQFGSERFFTKEIYVHISNQYKIIILDEIEINYTCSK